MLSFHRTPTTRQANGRFDGQAEGQVAVNLLIAVAITVTVAIASLVMMAIASSGEPCEFDG